MFCGCTRRALLPYIAGIGNETYDDVGLENESLIVWYRVSAFPWFRKLYGHPQGERDLPPGNYTLLVTYSIQEPMYACVYHQTTCYSQCMLCLSTPSHPTCSSCTSTYNVLYRLI